MTLFGRTFDGPEIATLVSMLLALALWVMAYRGDRAWVRWFRSWEAERKARREAEMAARRDEGGDRKGPWG